MEELRNTHPARGNAPPVLGFHLPPSTSSSLSRMLFLALAARATLCSSSLGGSLLQGALEEQWEDKAGRLSQPCSPETQNSSDLPVLNSPLNP